MNRLKWKDDKPATDKQKAYALDLLNGIKSIVDPFILGKTTQDQLNSIFWERAKIPDDLTFIEARNLIDDLISYRRSIHMRLPDNIMEAIIKRHSGGPFSTGYKSIMYTSVFADACEILVGFLRENGAIQ